MGRRRALEIEHCTPAPIADVPVLEMAAFRTSVIEGVKAGGRVSALFGAEAAGGRRRLYAVVSRPDLGTVELSSCEAPERYPSITPDCPQAHWFEREVAEQWGIVPEGHPWLKPIRFHRSHLPGKDAWGRGPDEKIQPGVTDYFRVEGEEVHEVAVGPVHAGVIEPGHFRFQCHGERVFSLEVSLGYQHRGVERALVGGPGMRTIHLMETLAGDTTIGHATAYCHAVEALSGVCAPPKAQLVRAVALELERIANHVGDLGALAGDVGFLPTMSYCGRLRGDFLNMTAALCGSRFGRGLVRPGGVAQDVGRALADGLLEKLDAAMRDTEGAVRLLFNTPSVLARFENTGILSTEAALSLGVVGPAARASGLGCDVRVNFPSGHYTSQAVPIATCDTGDVYARADVRLQEVRSSAEFVRRQLISAVEGPARADAGPMAPESVCVSLVEGWRGEICHVAMTGRDGTFSAYKVVDPSFHNWAGLAFALRNQQISDFPLCNKSFNLSYCGHDL